MKLSEEQEMIRDSARRFLGAACPPSLVRAAHERPEVALGPLWQQMAELQWAGLIVPECYSGAGASFLTLVVLLEEMGSVCLPAPFFSTVVLGGLCLLDFATDVHKADLLPRLASGDLRLTLAVQEGASEFDWTSLAFSARRVGTGYELSGKKILVPDAKSAAYLICVCRAEGPSAAPGTYNLLLLPRQQTGVTCTGLHTIGGSSFSDVTCDGVRVGLDALLNTRPIPWTDLQGTLCKAAVGKSAEMVGGAQRAMNIALDYATKRKQFGKPIGAFQAIQHHCVNMLMAVESARRLTYRCATMIDAGDLTTADAAMAKAWSNQSYREVVRLAHQVMGGIGYIEDHEMPLYTRHARQNEAMLGDTDTMLDIIAAELIGADRWLKRETVLL